MRRPISFLANIGFETRPAAEVAETLTGLGYDTIEWPMEHVDTLVEPACAIACQQDLVTHPEAGLAATKLAIDRAAERGIPTVNVLTGPNLWEPGAAPRRDEEAWQVSLHALEQACAHAEPLGVQVSLEPCWGTLAYDAATARRALEAVPCTVTFDPSHFVMTGDDIPSLVREWGERIAHVHLKDAFGLPGFEGEDFHFCLLGEGKVPWAELFSALDEVGYGGPVSVEFEAYRYLDLILGGDPVEAAQLGLHQARALIGEAAP
ncbi:MAG: sugar phosphate isomerase/epimerase family protein [Acidimicrobiia bacterium]